ncbi:MAG: rhodanese-like domain-containing protein, partial [Alphaproteobacteria bacterium]|nr:rhodanese-like domain-containing protein [Alphaproteobacteria bacterium]
MVKSVTAAALHARLRDDAGEIALLDLRERGAHGRGHPLMATCLPLSRLELDIDRLVPRRRTSIVVFDDGSGVRGAETLARLGYSDVAVLEGGLDGWRAGGLEVFDGVYVPSKAFGEFIEQECETPHISADELARLQAENADMVILDSRPLREFRRMSLPGGA